jgi:membrane associated rhomboid family serine protease
MIPYKDVNPTRTFPFVTIALIVINVLVFFYELTYPGGMDRLVLDYGAIPANLVFFQDTQPIGPITTIFTSMFMHGGFLHIGGNMLYLWIFGNNIEDVMGHFRYIIFYLVSGIAAVYAFSLSDPSSVVPMIGASGAISGVLGAYLLLFPRAQVYTLVFLGFFIQVIRLPALIVIGFWAIIQLVSGFAVHTGAQGGVAFFAHVGGFVFGIAAIKIFLIGRRR